MKNLIFDFDGVLGDTWEVLHDAKCAVEPTLSRAEHEARSNTYFTAPPDHGRAHSKTPEEVKKMYDWNLLFGSKMGELGIPLFNDFIAEIKKIQNARIAIVSTGTQVYVLPAVVETGLNPTHTLAFENHHSKEEKIETVCTDWGVPVSDAYYFTDTLVDVYELRDLLPGDKLIGVAWGFCGVKVLAEELKPEHILQKPADIHTLFQD